VSVLNLIFGLGGGPGALLGGLGLKTVKTYLTWAPLGALNPRLVIWVCQNKLENYARPNILA
jgi:hypothetical protein